LSEKFESERNVVRAAMSHSSFKTLTDSAITFSRDAPPFGSRPGTTTMHGQPTAAAMLLSSSHSRLIDSYADASRKVMCSMELMLKGEARFGEKILELGGRSFFQKSRSFAAQISR
jgi:hypothetical protein